MTGTREAGGQKTLIKWACRSVLADAAQYVGSQVVNGDVPDADGFEVGQGGVGMTRVEELADHGQSRENAGGGALPAGRNLGSCHGGSIDWRLANTGGQ
jgi:hypothetical protein